MLYVFYITTTPYLPCNNKNINRKELYDFYYTAITLATGYKHVYRFEVRSCFSRGYFLKCGHLAIPTKLHCPKGGQIDKSLLYTYAVATHSLANVLIASFFVPPVYVYRMV